MQPSNFIRNEKKQMTNPRTTINMTVPMMQPSKPYLFRNILQTQVLNKPIATAQNIACVANMSSAIDQLPSVHFIRNPAPYSSIQYRPTSYM